MPAGVLGYGNGLIRYGPAFPTVRRVLSLGPRRVVTECLLPEPPTAEPPGPASAVYAADLGDVATHGILVWLARNGGAVCLPAVTRRLAIYREAPRGEPFYVTLDVDELDDTSVEFGFWAHDAAGLVYLRGEGLRMTLLRGDAELAGETPHAASATVA